MSELRINAHSGNPVSGNKCTGQLLAMLMRPWARVNSSLLLFMMTSSNGNIFRVTGPLCGNSPITGEFPAQRPVARSFDDFCYLRLNKQLSKQSRGWWFETLSRSLWRHCNVSIFSALSDHCLSSALQNQTYPNRLFHNLEFTIRGKGHE